MVNFVLKSADESRISFQWRPTEPSSTLTDSQALRFLRWLLSGVQQAECRGERMIWRWSRVH